MKNGFAFFSDKKKLVISIIVLCILVVGGILFFALKPQNANVYTVRRETLVNTLLINGTYSVASQTRVYSPTNGIITKLFVQNNDEITKSGSPLFHAASTATDDQKKAAYANYLATVATYNTDNALLFNLQSTMYSAWQTYMDVATNSTYQNSDGSPVTNSRVLTPFTTAQDNWLGAEQAYKNQQSILAKDQAAVASTKLLYDETQDVTVTAPIVGKVVNLAAKVGDQVSAQSITDPTILPVLIIADFRNPVVTSSVDQVNMPRVKIGQPATIVFDALPDQKFSGNVTTMDTVGTKTQGTATYNVGIIVNNVSQDVKPNMTASLLIETLRKVDILTVPNIAIIAKGGKNYVQKEGMKDPTEIVLGAKGLTKTEVVSGLSLGDKIVIPQ